MRCRRNFLFLTGLLILFVSGCIKRPAVYNQPEIAKGIWEKAWVDPEIIMSDSLFTLIRSDRVDSFYINNPLSATGIKSLEFTISDSICFVYVKLENDVQGTITPLLAHKFPAGFYKLTPTKKAGEILKLRADICGDKKLVFIK